LGRQRIYSIPNQNEKIEDNTLALECFRVRDHFDLGSLPRNLFLVVLRELWHKMGQSLLPDEVVSISNAFECRDGRGQIRQICLLSRTAMFKAFNDSMSLSSMYLSIEMLKEHKYEGIFLVAEGTLTCRSSL
jgi:hypothetical protein